MTSLLKIKHTHLLWIFFAILYLFSLSNFLTYGDSGELLAASMRLGVAHPPGFPLYVFLGHAFHRLLPGPDAFRVALLSGVCAILCLQAVMRTLKQLCLDGESKRVAIYLSVGLLGVATCFWRYAVHIEVISLNAMLFMLCLERCVRVLNEKENQYRSFAWALLWFSLGVANHHTIIFVLPLLALAFIEIIPELEWKRILFLCVVSASFVFIYLIFALASDPGEPVSWRGFHTIDDIIHVFLRRDYGTFDLGVDDGGPKQSAAYLLDLWSRCVKDFGPFLLFLPLSLIPLWKEQKQHRRIILGLWAILIFSTVFFFSRFNVPLSGYMRANALKFYVLPQLVIVMLSGYGFTYAAHVLSTRTGRKLSGFLSLILVVFVLTFLSLSRLPLVNARDDRNLIDYCEQTLDSLPKDALVVAGSDDVLFGCGVYVQQTKKFRPDIFIFHLPPLYRERRVLAELLQKKHFVKETAFFSVQKDRPWAFALNLLQALPRSRVFLLDAQYGVGADHRRLLEEYNFVPYGAAIEIVRKTAKLDLDRVEAQTKDLYRTYESHAGQLKALIETYPDEFHYGVRLQTSLAQGWVELAALAQKENRPDISFRALEQAIVWAPWISHFYFAAAKLQQEHPQKTPSELEYIKLLDYASNLPEDYSYAVKPLGISR